MIVIRISSLIGMTLEPMPAESCKASGIRYRPMRKSNRQVLH
jgi:hypothetical protein